MSGRRAASERTAEVDLVAEVLKPLEAIADPARLAGMASYGISTTNALGAHPGAPSSGTPDGERS
jgi:hypothetical protein